MNKTGKLKIIKAVTVDKSLAFVEPIIDSLKQNYELILLSSPGEMIDKMCSQYRVKGYPVYMYRRMSPFKDVRSLLTLIHIFRKEKPHMVHSMTPKAGLLCMLAAWFVRVPFRLHTFTGLIWPTSTGIKRKILMFTDWVTCTCATHIIPEGKGVMHDLQSRITNKSMRVLGYGNVKGIDINKVSRRAEIIEKASKISSQEFLTFIFVGRLVSDKGINELVAAFKRLHCKYSNIRLILVGPQESNLDHLNANTLEDIKSHPNIDAVGPKYGDELLAYYASSDCFVFPSYREGFPNVILEAGAMDLPSIVTDINGSNEIIEHNRNGLIIPSKDEHALYDAMESIVVDKENRLRMAANARSIITSRFEQSFVIKCMLDYYKKIMM